MTNKGAFPGLPGIGADATSLRGYPVAPTAPGAASVLLYNAASGRYEPATVPVPPLAYGSVDAFRKTRAAFAKVTAGTANAKVAFVGDSTFALAQGGTYTQTVMGRTVPFLNARFPSRIAYAMAGWQTDSRITLGGSWTTGDNGGLGTLNASTWLIGSGNSGTLAFNPGFNTDTLEVVIQDQNSGTLDVNVNGGASLGTVSRINSGVLRQTTFTTTLGANTWNIVASAIAVGVQVQSLRAYNSTSREVHFVNFARSTVSSGYYLTTGNFGTKTMLDFYAPDLMILSLGINDAGSAVPSSSWYQNMVTTIQQQQARGGDVLLCSFVPTNPLQGSGYPTYEPQYQALMQSLAAQTNVAWLDAPWGRWGGSYSIANGLGFMFDNLHPNPVGNSDWAQAVATVLSNV